MSPKYTDLIYDVLVEECNAPESYREMFNRLFPGCIEFRFQGNQGYGGKVWYDRRGNIYVTNYPEDDTPEIKAARDRANERLAKF